MMESGPFSPVWAKYKERLNELARDLAEEARQWAEENRDVLTEQARYLKKADLPDVANRTTNIVIEFDFSGVRKDGPVFRSATLASTAQPSTFHTSRSSRTTTNLATKPEVSKSSCLWLFQVVDSWIPSQGTVDPSGGSPRRPINTHSFCRTAVDARLVPSFVKHH